MIYIKILYILIVAWQKNIFNVLLYLLNQSAFLVLSVVCFSPFPFVDTLAAAFLANNYFLSSLRYGFVIMHYDGLIGI